MTSRQTMLLVPACICTAVLFACEQAAPPPPVAVRARAVDTMLEHASAIAVARIDQFTFALQHPEPDQRGFMIKIALDTVDGSTEDIWVSAVGYADRQISAIVDDKPEDITSINVGDTLVVPQADIIDWMFTDNDQLVGGWTLRVQIDFSSPGERSLMMNHLGLTERDLQLPPMPPAEP